MDITDNRLTKKQREYREQFNAECLERKRELALTELPKTRNPRATPKMIQGKLGTHSSETFRIDGRIRKPLEAGDLIRIKRNPFSRGQRWIHVRIWRVNPAVAFYFLEYV